MGRPDDRSDDLLWSRLMTLFAAARDSMFAVLARHDLTPPHGFAMTMLADGPRRMGDLADLMTCDASYITSVVDRLEEVGLAERRTNAADRRVKEIALTAEGAAVAAEIRRTMTSPPPAFDRLSRAERTALSALVAKVVPDDEIAAEAFRPPRQRA